MIHATDISSELVRLAQLKSRRTGHPLNQQLALLVAEEEIVGLNPELNFILGNNAYCEMDSLVEAIGANDIVVNGKHIDVRIVDSSGRVSVERSLIGTPYLMSGSLVVALPGGTSGAVVNYIGPEVC